jgi:hypothetical protein
MEACLQDGRHESLIRRSDPKTAIQTPPIEKSWGASKKAKELFMRKRLAFARPLAVLSLAVLCGGAIAQNVPPSPPPNAPVPYVLSMGDMMNTLVQPRHAKLGLAGKNEAWAIAGYALTEIRQVFAGIVKAQPRFHGLPVGDLVEAALSQPENDLDTAIKQRDPQKFAEAFDRLTQGCNACHAAADHPYVVIKAPDASAFPNQDFSSRR